MDAQAIHKRLNKAITKVLNQSSKSKKDKKRDEETVATTPGLALALIYNNQVVYEGAWGYANITNEQKITPDTRFDLASVGKQFTAAGILICIKKGFIRSIYDSVSRYLPPFKKLKQIRIVDLLTHRTGLHEYFGYEKHWKTNKQVVERMLPEGVQYTVGSKHEYCNTNYVSLAHLIETVSGVSMSEFLRAEIFNPIGMHNTYLIDMTITTPDPIRATGYISTNNNKKKKKKKEKTDNNNDNDAFKVSEDDMAINGDGGVVSSVRDLILWDAALRKKGFGLGLSNKLTSLLYKLYPYTEPKEEEEDEDEDKEEDEEEVDEDEEEDDEEEEEEEDEDNYYALGWQVTHDGEGGSCAFHTGSWAGVQAYFVRDIKPRGGKDAGLGCLSIIALSNVEGEPIDITSIVDDVYEAFLDSHSQE